MSRTHRAFVAVAQVPIFATRSTECQPSLWGAAVASKTLNTFQRIRSTPMNGTVCHTHFVSYVLSKFKEADSDGNGRLDFKEVKKLLFKLNTKLSGSLVKKKFKVP